MSVNTKSVQGRRDVHYENLDELLADAERLASTPSRMLGNWSLGQLFGHLATSLNASIDGFPGSIPWPFKIVARLFMKRMVFEGPLKPGFKLPSEAEAQMVPSADTSVDEGLERLRQAIARQKSEHHRVPHLAFGNLSLDQWTRAHLRHAEMHMSFVVPVNS